MERMAILGPAGTHSEAAADYFNGKRDEKSELVICAEIYEALHKVQLGEADSAFVPVENSLEGAVSITLDTLAHSDDLIVAEELVWPVHNHLMAKCSIDDIRAVYSHAQPLSQCRAFLRERLPYARLEAVSSTAWAAHLAGEAEAKEGVAAICTFRAGELNGLHTLASEIQDNMANCTRFFEVRKSCEPYCGRERINFKKAAYKALIICQMDGSKPGSLYDVLGEFALRGVNMIRIESRPARTNLGAYIFFFDLEIDDNYEAMEEAVNAVGKRTIWLKRLGIFPVTEAKK